MPRPLPPATNEEFTTRPPATVGVRAHALAIHGYTGTPWEVLPVSMALADLGVTTRGIVLPGHEGDHTVLDRTSWRDWVDAAERAFDVLPPDKPRVLVGSSMGALVSLVIAAKRPRDVDALVLLAPALRFYVDGRVAAAASARAGLWRFKRSIVKEPRGGDIRDDDARALVKSYPVLPLRGVGELGLLQGVAERGLRSVVAPACLIHGGQDHTIPPVASELIAKKLGSARVERHVLRDSFHVIGVDVDRDELCAIASGFIADVLGLTRAELERLGGSSA